MNYTQTMSGPMAPTANLTVNKSRLKVYKNAGELPTYYLQKGQEFSIEIFNPTTHTILAKIILNGNPISQGGLVLKPGERVFLDRYLDVAKKFMFDTYEVSKSEEVKQAIAKNGDFKVQFFRERQPNLFLGINTTNNCGGGILRGNTYNPIVGTTTSGYVGQTTTNVTYTSGISPQSFTNVNYSSPIHDGLATMDCMEQDFSREIELSEPKSLNSNNKYRSKVETGRVEKGSDSKQIIKTVDLIFEYSAFHTVEYKMLPVSQKINTSEDINIKRYCTKCGAKTSKDDKYCSKCGNKI
jgi:ribosomal protein L40E